MNKGGVNDGPPKVTKRPAAPSSSVHLRSRRSGEDLRNHPLVIGIGSTLYRFDINRRVYRKPEPGQIGTGGPIYDQHFEALKIIGETKISWVLEGGFKAPKRTAARLFKKYLTAAEMDEDCWAHVHRPRIRDALSSCSVTHLREIARILGYRG